MSATWIASASLILFLTACGGTASLHSSGHRVGVNIPTGALDFGWRLSGERSVAPLQVFSDPTHIWLHWQPHQTIPAIFGVTESGEQIVDYESHGPYAKLDGRWDALVFRGAHQQARARRIHTQSAPSSSIPTVANSPVTPSVAQPVTEPISASTTASQAFYAITPGDKNLRQALSRWSGLSGWRFQAEHWSVDVDIPLTATANFSDDFIASVRALIEATELSDRPLQPCFYANQVLRIVPLTEACDRTLVEGARV